MIITISWNIEIYIHILVIYFCLFVVLYVTQFGIVFDQIQLYLTGGKGLVGSFSILDFKSWRSSRFQAKTIFLAYMSLVLSRQSLSVLNHHTKLNGPALFVYGFVSLAYAILPFTSAIYKHLCVCVCVLRCWMGINCSQTSFDKVFYLWVYARYLIPNSRLVTHSP